MTATVERVAVARHCVVCDAELDGAQELYCSGACGAEASRLRAILAGRGAAYRSIRTRLAARGQRTRSLLRIAT